MTYCERCGGELGWGCRGKADCDLNMELLRDEVSPEFFVNPLARTIIYDRKG